MKTITWTLRLDVSEVTYNRVWEILATMHRLIGLLLKEETGFHQESNLTRD